MGGRCKEAEQEWPAAVHASTQNANRLLTGVLPRRGGGHAWAPAKPRPDETLIRALVRAHRWKRMLEDGMYRASGGIAEAEGITRSFVNRVLRLTLLAPDIQERILEGRQPKGMQLEDLTKPLPSAWEEQRKTVLTTG